MVGSPREISRSEAGRRFGPPVPLVDVVVVILFTNSPACNFVKRYCEKTLVVKLQCNDNNNNNNNNNKNNNNNNNEEEEEEEEIRIS